MAVYTTINDPSAHFQTAIYTGTGSNQSITNDGNTSLQPDLVWVKDRGASNDHKITDSNRLASGKPTITLEANTDLAEYDDASPAATTSFDVNGFTIGTNGNYNTNTNTYVAWQWKANGGTTSTNTAGTNIDTTIQTNSTAGFSIITYTGTGNANDSLGHGLGADVHFCAIKARERGTGGQWAVYHKDMHSSPQDYYLRFDIANLPTDSAATWNDVDPTSTVINLGTGNRVNTSSDNTYVGYIWTGIQGFSKFGSYLGNGNADGPMIYTGFKPALVITKSVTSSGDDWCMQDYKRDPVNDVDDRIMVNDNGAASTTDQWMDWCSNGFKPRVGDGKHNGSGIEYVYMAWAQNPFVTSTGIPCTAR